MAKSRSSYIPFARKYRPKNFSELVGQEVLTKTLSYCISNKKLPGAILLTGIRGVGKTSSARIVAKTINCTSLSIDENNPYKISPCEKCKNCESLKNGNHPDVIEVDAASRTGVDDIREIIESSEYRPLLGEYKIFIIDEVHMLSKNAFNALLKIIEEPPPHLILIFATTEVQKIPLTVLSRCQRYDLRRLSFEEILSLLHQISKNEKLDCQEEALKIIALKSEGSARDAIAILDQASSYVHTQNDTNLIDSATINNMLGLVQVSTILRLIQLIIAGNTSAAIKIAQEIYISSSNIEYFIQQVADFIAHLTKEKMIPGFHNPLYVQYSTEITNILIGITISRLSVLWQIFNNGAHEVKSSHNELTTLEMLIIKAIYSFNMPKIEEIFGGIPDDVIANEAKQSKEVEAIFVVSPEIATPSAMARNDGNKQTTIFDFLKFCHSENEMSLYYFLLNETEVKNFADQRFEIATKTKDYDEKLLKSLLSKWSGKEWSVVITKQNEIISLKQKLLEQVKNSEDFAVIKNYFPNADISDIILKTQN